MYSTTQPRRVKASAWFEKRGCIMSVLTAEKLEKTYLSNGMEVQALRGVDFTIEPGMLVSFIGPSGSGKTTLLNLIGALDKPTGGALIVAGTDVARLSKKQAARFRGENIGFVFQDFNLIPVLTVYENIEYPLVMVKSLAAVQRRENVEALLEAVGMADQRNKYPDKISGGQKQRVAVARALVTHPRLVLADEPTANLDSKTAYLVIELMKKMKNELKTTFIFSTHDHKIVENAEIIYTLEDGLITSARKAGSQEQQ